MTAHEWTEFLPNRDETPAQHSARCTRLFGVGAWKAHLVTARHDSFGVPYKIDELTSGSTEIYCGASSMTCELEAIRDALRKLPAALQQLGCHTVDPLTVLGALPLSRLTMGIFTDSQSTLSAMKVGPHRTGIQPCLHLWQQLMAQCAPTDISKDPGPAPARRPPFASGTLTTREPTPEGCGSWEEGGIRHYETLSDYFAPPPLASTFNRIVLSFIFAHTCDDLADSDTPDISEASLWNRQADLAARDASTTLARAIRQDPSRALCVTVKPHLSDLRTSRFSGGILGDRRDALAKALATREDGGTSMRWRVARYHFVSTIGTKRDQEILISQMRSGVCPAVGGDKFNAPEPCPLCAKANAFTRGNSASAIHMLRCEAPAAASTRFFLRELRSYNRSQRSADAPPLPAELPGFVRRLAAAQRPDTVDKDSPSARDEILSLFADELLTTPTSRHRPSSEAPGPPGFAETPDVDAPPNFRMITRDELVAAIRDEGASARPPEQLLTIFYDADSSYGLPLIELFVRARASAKQPLPAPAAPAAQPLHTPSSEESNPPDKPDDRHSPRLTATALPTTLAATDHDPTDVSLFDKL